MTAARTLTDDDRTFVRYTRTRHWPLLERFPVSDELHIALLAQMLDCPEPVVREILDDPAAQVRRAGAQMLTDARYSAILRALPFGPDDRIVAVGDSITADRLGWFELLRATAALAGAPTSHLINLGVSGNTSADVLERFDLLEGARPSHVLLMLGTNDARAHGRTVKHRMASAAETERNLVALLDLIGNDLSASTTVITPPSVDQDRVDAFFADAPLGWHAADVAEIAEIARKVAPDCLDLHTLTRIGDLDTFLGTDGVHPTLEGNRLILTHVVGHLAAGGGPLV